MKILDHFTGRFIAGQCRLYSRATDGTNCFWQKLPYPGRGWYALVAIARDLDRRFPGMYDLEITADMDVARPRW